MQTPYLPVWDDPAVLDRTAPGLAEKHRPVVPHAVAAAAVPGGVVAVAEHQAGKPQMVRAGHLDDPSHGRRDDLGRIVEVNGRDEGQDAGLRSKYHSPRASNSWKMFSTK
jgi:hypothetical protein